MNEIEEVNGGGLGVAIRVVSLLIKGVRAYAKSKKKARPQPPKPDYDRSKSCRKP